MHLPPMLHVPCVVHRSPLPQVADAQTKARKIPASAKDIGVCRSVADEIGVLILLSHSKQSYIMHALQILHMRRNVQSCAYWSYSERMTTGGGPVATTRCRSGATSI